MIINQWREILNKYNKLTRETMDTNQLSNVNDFSDAMIGDKVYDIIQGPGIIIKTDALGDYPIGVSLEDKECTGRKAYSTYTLDGHVDTRNTGPSLYWSKPEITIPPKPKRKVTRTIERWINIYPHNAFESSVYTTRADAERCQGLNCIGQVMLTGSYEREE